MKKTIFYSMLSLLIHFSSSNVFAQYTATWPLLTANGKVPSVTGAQAANVVAQQMIPGSVFAAGTHNSDGFQCATTANWPTAPTEGMFLEFPLSPDGESHLSITGGTLTAKTSGSSGSTMLAFQYQVDGTGAWTSIGSPLEAPSGGTSNHTLGTLNIAFENAHTYVIRAYVYAKATGTSASRKVYIKNVAFTGSVTSANTPTINLSAASLPSFGNVLAGSVSGVQSYSVSGIRLTENVALSAQAGFQISTDSITFANSISLPQTGGVLPSTRIYVRFAPAAAAGKVTGSISHSSQGAVVKKVTVEGVALAIEPTVSSNVSFGTLTGTSIIVNVNGGNGISRIIVARANSPVSWLPTDGVSIVGENSDFGLAVDQGNGNKVVLNLPDSVSRTVTVTGLEVGTTYHFAAYEYNGSAGAENYLTSNPGIGNTTTLTVPGIFAAPATIKFGNVLIGSTSPEKMYSLSAKFLDPVVGNLTITATQYFEISLSSGSGFSNSLSLPYSSGTLAATPIYVRFSPTAINDYSGTISHTGGGATEKLVALSGFGRDSSAFITKAIYVSPDGNDATGTGAIDKPYRTVYKAGLKLTNDFSLVLRGGIYMQDSLILRDKTLTNIAIINYPGEYPIINGTTSYDCVVLYCNNSLMKGIEVTKAGHNGLWLMGHNNRIELCKFHDGGDSGVKIGSHYETNYPRGNLILNCEAYRNYDTRGNGGNADGFSAKWKIGSGNKFVGCRAWENSDDGWDLWQADSLVVMDSCWCFRNGHDVFHVGSNGNGNGFKIGGAPVCVPHIMRNCIAFDNTGDSGGKGFDQNSNLAGHIMYNCISFGNSYLDFNFYKASTNGTLIAKNNIQFKGTTSPYIKFVDGDIKNNSWKAFSWQTGYSWAGFTVTDNDFESVDTTLALAPRLADGSLPQTPFLRLKSTSQLINRGLDVGLPFFGSAPDLGPFEYGLTTAVKSEPIVGPRAFELSQNYPNPFNPSTTIRFTLPQNGNVTLSVYDMLGRELVTLVDEQLQSGVHSVSFDGSRLSSGIYLYRLTADGSSLSRKMNLIK